jgi:hypothetical protein
MHKRLCLFIPVTIVTAVLLMGMGSQGSWAQGPGQASQSSSNPAQSHVAVNPGGIVLSRGNWVFYLAPGQTQPQKLVQGMFPALSPDGQRLAYVQTMQDKGGGKDLAVFDMATGQSFILVPSEGENHLFYPSWSPQGDQLAFVYDLKDINIVKPDGSERRKIFTVPGGAYAPPVWGPGKSLLVHDLNDLYQIDLQGKELAKRPLTSFTGKPDAVSSTDRFLTNPVEPQLWAFTMFMPGTPKFTSIFGEPVNALFLFDVRTLKRTRLTPPDMLAMDPCWSRDGQTLYFCGYGEPQYQEKYPFRIYRIDKNGSGLTELVSGEYPNQ